MCVFVRKSIRLMRSGMGIQRSTPFERRYGKETICIPTYTHCHLFDGQRVVLYFTVIASINRPCSVSWVCVPYKGIAASTFMPDTGEKESILDMYFATETIHLMQNRTQLN